MRIRLSRSIVPNLFTVLNIFFGFLCIINAVQGRFLLAALYVLLSAVCDALDGFMARLTNSASEFGVELDSLADVVSFGVAPSFLYYALFLKDHGTFGMLVAAVPLIMGALRLARFNVQLVGFHKEYFTGMPIPLSALALSSAIYFLTPETIHGSADIQHLLMALTIACGVLMISTVRYPVFPNISPRSFREKPVQMSLMLLAAIIVISSMGRLLFPVLLVIIVSGPIFAAGRWLRSSRSDDDEADSLTTE